MPAPAFGIPLAMLAAAALVSACSVQDPFVGTWTLQSSSCTGVSQGPPPAVTASFGSDGTYSYSVASGPCSGAGESGTYARTGMTMTMSPATSNCVPTCPLPPACAGGIGGASYTFIANAPTTSWIEQRSYSSNPVCASNLLESDVFVPQQ